MTKPNTSKALLHLAKAELELIDIKKEGEITIEELSLINSVICEIRSAYRSLKVIDKVWGGDVLGRVE